MPSFHIAPGFIIGSPHLAICSHPGLRPSPSLATTAAESAFSCRCGSPGTVLSPRETPLGPLRSYAPCHNGSEFRIFLPLRKPRNWPSPAGDASRGTPVLRPLPQWQRILHFPAVVEAPELADPCGRHFPGHLGPPPLATTAAKPAFSCRCGSTEVPILSLCILGVWQYTENE